MTEHQEQTMTPDSVPSCCLIDSHAVLQIQGEDAVKFLQGQCSADIAALCTGESVPGAICTVKGRVVSSFFAHKTDADILLVMPRDLISITHEYLKKYAAFFKVEIVPWEHRCVLSNPALLGNISCSYCKVQVGMTEFHLGLFDAEQSETLLKQLDSDSVSMTEEAEWLDQLLKSGWVVLSSATTEEYLPHPLNLDLLGAVNFKKGCYTGQEIIARTEYRGKSKRRVQLLFLQDMDKTDTPIELPVDIYQDSSDRALGQIINISSKNDFGLALLPVEMESSGNMLIQSTDTNYKVETLPF